MSVNIDVASLRLEDLRPGMRVRVTTSAGWSVTGRTDVKCVDEFCGTTRKFVLDPGQGEFVPDFNDLSNSYIRKIDEDDLQIQGLPWVKIEKV